MKCSIDYISTVGWVIIKYGPKKLRIASIHRSFFVSSLKKKKSNILYYKVRVLALKIKFTFDIESLWFVRNDCDMLDFFLNYLHFDRPSWLSLIFNFFLSYVIQVILEPLQKNIQTL